MNVDHHDLRHEFPEYAKTIQNLKLGSWRFAHLLQEYENLTTQIEELEIKDLPVADTTIEDMKKLRLKLKDDLYALLRQAGKAT